jgi:dTDP-4-amino-4,6-dideoxygalactose transaminase
VSTSFVTGAEVPFLDLRASHEPLAEAILLDLAELIESNAFINGPAVAQFEERFAAFCGSAHCVGTASGLDALRLALLAAELEPGDEVIVPAQTFVATLEAVTQAGLRPVLADVREDDYGLDVDAVADAIGGRTQAVMPVHLFGQMVDLARLDALASARGLALVEDACQAHGATRDGFGAGAAGLAGAFSFYPGKNLGAFGDAGALVTDDARLASRARALREHGQRRKYEHEREGYTARLDTIQAAVLLRKLPLLEEWNESRRAAARLYTAALRGVGDLRLPHVPAGSEPVWHLYVVRTADPAALAAHLAERGVGTGRHYPQPVHLSEAYAWLGHGEGDFPVAERLAAESLSLPLYPGITETQIDAVVRAVASYFGHG